MPKRVPFVLPHPPAPDTEEVPHHNEHSDSHKKMLPLFIGAVGVVYGDIGTSPLYAFRESLKQAAQGGAAERTDVLGIISLILWALILTVTVKYVFILLRADNNGEGGTLSLMALASRAIGKPSLPVFLLGVLGAALFFGDAMITPAVSVLSAVEGLALVAPSLEHMVIPITLVILILLFSLQAKGTGRVAVLFGPFMIFWFIAIGVMGLIHISDDPTIFYAFNPVYGIKFLFSDGWAGLIALGFVFLAVTGAEALYADLGHFGKKPVQYAWYYLVFPALALNYLGQGALVLAHPEAAANPFFHLAPSWAALPVVIMATFATIIASQAVITGAFSYTHQAIQLKLLPRMEIKFTSEHERGQIYLPRVNRNLLIGVLLLVLFFGSSGSLAAIYGIAVTGEMVITALLLFIVVKYHWKLATYAAALLVFPFLLIDVLFFSASLTKVFNGGYLPLVFGVTLALCIITWVRGQQLLSERATREGKPFSELQHIIKDIKAKTVKGTAIYLADRLDILPHALASNLKHNKIVHEHNIVLHFRTMPVPRVAEKDKITITEICDRFSCVIVKFGFMETPDVRQSMRILKELHGFKNDSASMSYFLGHRSLKPDAGIGLPLWQDHIFISMYRSASNATDYYNLPLTKVVEIGTQVRI